MTAAPTTELISSRPNQSDRNLARAAVLGRLEELKRQRAQAEIESVPPGASGDLADRASNVEALIRLENLEARIIALEVRLDELLWEGEDPAPDGSAARIGSWVTLSFHGDDSPETFRLDRIEQAQPGEAVITPDSPLGRALLGAQPGQRVTYRARGSHQSAELLEIAV